MSIMIIINDHDDHHHDDRDHDNHDDHRHDDHDDDHDGHDDHRHDGHPDDDHDDVDLFRWGSNQIARRGHLDGCNQRIRIHVS